MHEREREEGGLERRGRIREKGVREEIGRKESTRARMG